MLTRLGIIIISVLIFGWWGWILAAIPPKNLGFIPSNIWFSEEPFFAGDKIRIYTVLFNNTKYDLTGKVEFNDNGTLIGKNDFSIAGGGRARDVWVDWNVGQGNHTVSAKIIDAKISLPGGKSEIIIFEDTLKSEKFADLDTDGDRIGNLIDDDDDNDSISDQEEIAKGTDPLKKEIIPQAVSDGGGQQGQSGIIPPILVSGAKAVIGTVNNLADRGAEKIEAKKMKIRESLSTTTVAVASSDGGSAEPSKISGIKKIVAEKLPIERPAKYLYLMFLSALGFILKNKVLLYLILGLIMYRFITLLYRRNNV